MGIAAEDPLRNRRALIEMAAGVALIIAGAVIFITGTDDSAYVIGGVPIFSGVVVILHGMAGLTGYKSFVAWRYLLVHEQKVTLPTKVLVAVALLGRMVFYMVGAPIEAGVDMRDPIQIAAATSVVFFITVVFWGVLRYSKPAMILFLFGVGVGVVAEIGEQLVASDQLPLFSLGPDAKRMALQVLGIVKIVGGAIAGLAAFFGSLRAFFTFFTTVPIGGVWIGTAALVIVLAVMSGFESDLRDKILGSNAHIQITREDGEFVDWRDAKAKIDRIPGVVASTPYAVSEVVIASHNNGMNVIIKGIDPDTVGKVTDLISDIRGDDKEGAMRRLFPQTREVHDRSVPQQPKTSGGLDPPPDDMPTGGDPIDFSRPSPGAGGGGSAPLPRGTAPPPRTGRAPPAGGSAAPAGGSAAIATDGEPYGGDAAAIVAAGDPPPADLLTTDDRPIDYSQPGAITDPPIDVSDLPLMPSMSRRIEALPGILVGTELEKQTNVYVGQEVRVVSPLSDPSNPDATGTPIPFNRDYRVAGMFYTGMYEYDLKYVYVTLESLQDFLDRGDSVDGIEVRIEDADDTGSYVPTETGAGLIREALGPGYRIVDWRELNRSLFSALKLEKIAMFLVLGIVILVASFSIVGNLIMVVIEKARQIALLKTLGASDFGIMQLFAIQGLLIGLIGTILGVLTGLLGCWAGKKFGIPLNPDVYYIDRLPIHVDWQSVAAAAAAGVLISIAATLYPALLAARVRPADGMRH